eukprot:TRINITY_DN10363_c0_g1_i2.p1 TRINITY_DN10363_c0_g1~~TRINITY_DN10363_c0_g1_i2.p1  ORF type:complete len:181 (+),score=6.83 TRINITY_DN10363_c0_g1_i2:34-576(+)
MKILSIILLMAFALNSLQINDQCDPEWGSIRLGDTNTTICQNNQLGSLLLLLSDYIDGNTEVCERNCTPKDLNLWLNRNEGWDDRTGGIRWKALERAGIFLVDCTTDQKKITKSYEERSRGFDILASIFGGKLWARVASVSPQRIGVIHTRSNGNVIKISWSQVVKACHIEDSARSGRFH